MRLDQFGFYFFNYSILFSIFIELLERQYLCPLLVETSDYAGLSNIQYKYAIENNLKQSEYNLIQLSKLLLLNSYIWNIECEIEYNFSTHFLKTELNNFHSVLEIILDLKTFKSNILHYWAAKMANEKGELEISQILNNISLSEAKTARILAQY
uniref:Uncharacterized protein orf153a n=1 Tax=Chara vulgaris TaxID=55564 RepID=Q1ACM6_CHAVU|nr:hypothetical protein ChvuCp018 [Chara vulgaris]ABA61989.1 hypothetical protein [Chara vulgaris]